MKGGMLRVKKEDFKRFGTHTMLTIYWSSFQETQNTRPWLTTLGTIGIWLCPSLECMSQCGNQGEVPRTQVGLMVGLGTAEWRQGPHGHLEDSRTGMSDGQAVFT